MRAIRGAWVAAACVAVLGCGGDDDGGAGDAAVARDGGPRVDAGPCDCDPDLDGDGIVGNPDVSMFNSCMLPGAVGCEDADLNCDGALDRCDFEIIRCSFGTAPEPSCCAMRACGACTGAFEDGTTCRMQAPETCASLMASYEGDGTTCP